MPEEKSVHSMNECELKKELRKLEDYDVSKIPIIPQLTSFSIAALLFNSFPGADFNSPLRGLSVFGAILGCLCYLIVIIILYTNKMSEINEIKAALVELDTTLQDDPDCYDHFSVITAANKAILRITSYVLTAIVVVSAISIQCHISYYIVLWILFIAAILMRSMSWKETDHENSDIMLSLSSDENSESEEVVNSNK